MTESGPVDRAGLESIRRAGRPVVLRGQASEWPIVQAARQSDAAAVAYLKRFADDRALPALVGEPGIAGRFFYDDSMRGFNFTRGTSALGPLLDRLLRDRSVPRPFAIAVQSQPLPDALPGLMADCPMPLVDASIVPRIWLGNAIRVAPHFDLMENIGCVAIGRRRFTIFPPEQVANLYMGPLELTPAGTPVSMVDLAQPDLVRYPHFAAAWAEAEQVVLEPGDALYLPFHWWHAVDSLDGVNAFINYWWNAATDAPEEGYDVLLHALMVFRNLPQDQRRAWRAMFDHLAFAVDGEPLAHLPGDARGVLGPQDATGRGRMRATLIEALDRRSH